MVCSLTSLELGEHGEATAINADIDSNRESAVPGRLRRRRGLRGEGGGGLRRLPDRAHDEQRRAARGDDAPESVVSRAVSLG